MQICGELFGAPYHTPITSHVTQDPTGKIGPVAFSGDQWAGYDDAGTVAAKTRWAVSNGYGGVMIQDVGQDDFR